MKNAAFAKPRVKTPQHPVYQQLLQRLREVRKLQALTQADLGKLLGRPQSYVAKIESGERRLDVLEFALLTKALKIDPDTLFTELVASLEHFTPSGRRRTRVLS